LLARQQAESDIRLATEMVSLSDLTRQVRDVIGRTPFRFLAPS